MKRRIHKINNKIEEFLDKQKRIDETDFDAISKFDTFDKINSPLEPNFSFHLKSVLVTPRQPNFSCAIKA